MDIISWLASVVISALSTFLSLLMGICPFDKYENALSGAEQGLHWLNWVLPVQELLNLLALWLTCLLTYYVLTIILRWLDKTPVIGK